jgi:hypothetical protein
MLDNFKKIFSADLDSPFDFEFSNQSSMKKMGEEQILVF